LAFLSSPIPSFIFLKVREENTEEERKREREREREREGARERESFDGWNAGIRY
jgi:hypothetical protein